MPLSWITHAWSPKDWPDGLYCLLLVLLLIWSLPDDQIALGQLPISPTLICPPSNVAMSLLLGLFTALHSSQWTQWWSGCGSRARLGPFIAHPLPTLQPGCSQGFSALTALVNSVTLNENKYQGEALVSWIYFFFSQNTVCSRGNWHCSLLVQWYVHVNQYMVIL